MSPVPEMDALRQKMVQQQLAARDIDDPLVLDAMRSVPRHLFVSEEQQARAYWDGPLAIGEGQTISQPYIVALMTQLLELQGGERVLEVGCGSGYQAAVLACIARQVVSIERHASLAEQAGRRLAELGFANVHVLVGDGSLGAPDEEPFDGIVVTAAAPTIPPPLKEQLALNGRIVAPVGSPAGQTLKVLQRRSDGWHVTQSIPVVFVPLIGEHGWEEKEWNRGRWW